MSFPKPHLYTLNIHLRACIVFLHRIGCSDVKKNIKSGCISDPPRKVTTGSFAPVEGFEWEATRYNTWLEPLPLTQVLKVIRKMQNDINYSRWRKWYRCTHCMDIFVPTCVLTKNIVDLLIEAIPIFEQLIGSGKPNVGSRLEELAQQWVNLEYLVYNSPLRRISDGSPLKEQIGYFIHQGENPASLNWLISIEGLTQGI